MNETILASVGGPASPTVSITPWDHAEPDLGDATPAISSRVEGRPPSLTLGIGARSSGLSPLFQLRRLLTAALPLLRQAGARVRLSNSGLVLDCRQLAAALHSWTDEAVPVHSLISFDFALRGDPPGTGSKGLAALVGQEVVAWAPDEKLRLVAARMVVRLAHDMLLNGPILAETEYPAPEVPRGRVALIPRDIPSPIVQIRF